MNLVNIKTGKANMANASSECYVFYTPREGMDAHTHTETFVGKAAKDFKFLRVAPVKEHGSAIVVPSLSDMPEEIGGRFATATYQVQDGVIMKIYGKKREGWNGTMKHVVMFIKFRENAAHRMVKFFPNRSNKLTLEWLGVQGRFDIISMSEAEAFGAKVAQITRKLTESSDLSLLHLETLEEETVAPVGFVETADGKLIPQLKRRRKIEEV